MSWMCNRNWQLIVGFRGFSGLLHYDGQATGGNRMSSSASACPLLHTNLGAYSPTLLILFIVWARVSVGNVLVIPVAGWVVYLPVELRHRVDSSSLPSFVWALAPLSRMRQDLGNAQIYSPDRERWRVSEVNEPANDAERRREIR